MHKYLPLLMVSFSLTTYAQIPEDAVVIQKTGSGTLIEVHDETAKMMAKDLVSKGFDVKNACNSTRTRCQFIVLKSGRIIPVNKIGLDDEF